MPSGDTAQATLYALFLFYHLQVHWAILFLPPCVAVARVFYHCHWFGDTMGGALAGSLGFGLSVLAVWSLGFWFIINNQHFHRFPQSKHSTNLCSLQLTSSLVHQHFESAFQCIQCSHSCTWSTWRSPSSSLLYASLFAFYFLYTPTYASKSSFSRASLNLRISLDAIYLVSIFTSSSGFMNPCNKFCRNSLFGGF